MRKRESLGWKAMEREGREGSRERGSERDRQKEREMVIHLKFPDMNV